MSQMLLDVKNLEVRYGDLIGVSDVSLTVRKGSVVALLGSNGAGKTTTLNAIAGLIPTSGGRVTFDGAEITSKPAFEIVRNGLALAPEGWRLFVQQSVESNLLLGATTVGSAGTMSGGERQMLAVGRALMSDPVLLLLDEPSLGLAPAIIESMYETLKRLHGLGLTLLLAEQAVDLALEISDEAVVLQVGRNAMSGPSHQLANDPNVQKIYLGH